MACRDRSAKTSWLTWGVVNSSKRYIITAVAASHCPALAEQEERRELAPKEFWPLEVVSDLCRWLY